ncbi:MAG: ABC transporter permease [Coriobacteriales bacterium]|jgi:D-methionine transport system permease protein|nr:ABC transporter permease [Coriobacteriales bacterium]
MEQLAEFFAKNGPMLLDGTLATLVMVFASTLLAYLLGVPIAILVKVTEQGSLKPQPVLNTVLGWIINMGRSIPFIILMVAIIPFTRLVVGTSLGVLGAIVPLTVAAVPFVARLVESSFSEVNPNLVEASLAFGASAPQVIFKVWVREGLPSLLRGAAITTITLIAYSAMAGAVGAGGLGDIGIRYGYYRYQSDILLATIVILVVVVQVIQSAFDLVARRIDRR